MNDDYRVGVVFHRVLPTWDVSFPFSRWIVSSWAQVAIVISRAIAILHALFWFRFYAPRPVRIPQIAIVKVESDLRRLNLV